jgi:hypothetical protein
MQVIVPNDPEDGICQQEIEICIEFASPGSEVQPSPNFASRETPGNSLLCNDKSA